MLANVADGSNRGLFAQQKPAHVHWSGWGNWALTGSHEDVDADGSSSCEELSVCMVFLLQDPVKNQLKADVPQSLTGASRTGTGFTGNKLLLETGAIPNRRAQLLRLKGTVHLLLCRGHEPRRRGRPSSLQSFRKVALFPVASITFYFENKINNVVVSYGGTISCCVRHLLF